MPISTTQTFPEYTGAYPPGKKARVIVNAGSGEIEIAVFDDAGTAVPLSDGPWAAGEIVDIDVGGSRWQVTPSGGATYSWVEVN